MENIINIIGVISFIVSVISLFYAYIIEQKNKKIRSINWTDIHIATKKFWKSLKHENFTPSYIITPGQKGGIIAQVFSEFYDIDIPILTGFILPNIVRHKDLKDEQYLVIKTTKWYVYMPNIIKTTTNKSNMKILIIDDFTMSGDFLFNLKKELNNLGYKPQNIRSCSLAVTSVAQNTKKAPDYYYKEVEDSNFYFPWGKAK